MSKKNRKKKLKKKVRSKIAGADRLRLSVYRSNKHIYAQVIDDSKGETVAADSDLKINASSMSKVDRAKKVGLELTKKLKKKKIKKVVFDRGHYKYMGRVKALADAVRKGGIDI